MSETEMVERIPVTLSGKLRAFVEREAERTCISKDAVLCLALREYYERRCHTLDALGHIASA
jgi:hypothetical protein